VRPCAGSREIRARFCVDVRRFPGGEQISSGARLDYSRNSRGRAGSGWCGLCGDTGIRLRPERQVPRKMMVRPGMRSKCLRLRDQNEGVLFAQAAIDRSGRQIVQAMERPSFSMVVLRPPNILQICISYLDDCSPT